MDTQFFNETGVIYYENLSKKAKKTALKIEQLLEGLSIEEVNYMFLKIRKKISEQTKVQLLS